QAPQARKMLFTNLTPVSFPRRCAGRFATLAFVALLAGATAAAQSANPAQTSNPAPAQSNPAPGTAPMKRHTTAAGLAPGRGPSYENHWDVYVGFAFMNGQAGQNLPKRFNMG